MTNGYPAPRPLTRSLEPLEGESLSGYLLRLSFRLRVSPLRLAQLTGCASGTSGITRRRMLDLDVQRFARATWLSDDEARALTIASWSDRYPPVTRSRIGQGPPVILDNWLFANESRYCPDCLAGDDSPVQQQYGGRGRKPGNCPSPSPAPGTIGSCAKPARSRTQGSRASERSSTSPLLALPIRLKLRVGDDILSTRLGKAVAVASTSN